ncbi:MAG: hypothetical protein HC783_18440 [Rhodobacteraceae bacterium]|nr:hypothetical protein [Paracoccaceae bacterium]
MNPPFFTALDMTDALKAAEFLKQKQDKPFFVAVGPQQKAAVTLFDAKGNELHTFEGPKRLQVGRRRLLQPGRQATGRLV